MFDVSNQIIESSDYNSTQPFNSTLIDQDSVPELKNNNSTASGELPDSNSNSTMSGDNVELNNAESKGAGMDTSKEVEESR